MNTEKQNNDVDAAAADNQDEDAQAMVAAAAAAEEQLAAEVAASGQSVLPPEGRHGASNRHIMFTTRTHITCYMPPSMVDEKTSSVKGHLDDLLLRYLDDQEAILLAYSNLSVKLGQTFLHPKPPALLTVEAEADITTFAPRPGDIICGTVRKLSQRQLTLLVLGCISVTIDAAFMPPHWHYDLAEHCWVPGGDYSQAISRGDLVSCMLTTHPQQDPDEDEVLFNLQGSLLLPHTGLWPWQWPRQQRTRALLAAAHGQGNYSTQEDLSLCAQQQQLMQEGAARRQLPPLSASGKRRKHRHQREQQQGEQQQERLSKAARTAEKQAAREHKAQRRAESAARKAVRAADREARRAAKAARALAKAEKRARRQQQQNGDEAPPAKKQKHRHQHSADGPAGQQQQQQQVLQQDVQQQQQQQKQQHKAPVQRVAGAAAEGAADGAQRQPPGKKHRATNPRKQRADVTCDGQQQGRSKEADKEAGGHSRAHKDTKKKHKKHKHKDKVAS